MFSYTDVSNEKQKANTPFHKMCEDKTTIVSGYMETFLNINFTAWPTCLFTMSRKRIIILLLTMNVSNKNFGILSLVG